MIRTLIAVALLSSLAACRGEPSKLPPIHLNPNMDTQDKYKSYGESKLFEDGRTMRPVPEGTIQYGVARADDALYRGRQEQRATEADELGAFTDEWPEALKLDAALMQRGQQQFNIYCAPCHDQSGNGKGMVVLANAGLTPPPSFINAEDPNAKRIAEMPIGEVYNTVSYGKNTMAGYAAQIAVEDRWAIVAYLRALQRAQNIYTARN
ncbi:MAG: cytochrome c [Alphaproteobacteria bacterium]|nr:cytochrome c [Alphaproteobacteria bacterium]